MVSVVRVELDGQEAKYVLSFCGTQLIDGEFLSLDEDSCFWLEEKINKMLVETETCSKNNLNTFCVSVNFDNKTVFCDLGHNNGG